MIQFQPMEHQNIDAMSIDQLTAYRQELLAQVAELDAREPANMESEAYEVWADAHEVLEDLLDDIQDRLDDLEG